MRPPQRSNIHARLRSQDGFTLLELILALALSSVVLLAVGMAVQVQLRAYESRQGILEESQLARALLRIIADDIRRTVVDYEQDISVVKEMLEKAKSQTGGEGSPGGEGGESGGSGTSDGENEAGENGGGDSTDGSAGQGSGTAGSGQSGSGDGGFDDGEATIDETTDLANSTTLPATPGIYGNQSQLQIDMSRLPRLEEYRAMMPAAPGLPPVEIPSDIKTVTYFVQTGEDAGAAMAIDALATLDTDLATSQGLVRREMDRAIAQWSLNNGVTSFLQTGDLLAPEVVGLQFQYFDGYQWLAEWDTAFQEALPLAIEVVLLMNTSRWDQRLDPSEPMDEARTRSYRLIVHLPVGVAAALSTDDTAAESDTESDSESSTP